MYDEKTIAEAVKKALDELASGDDKRMDRIQPTRAFVP